MYNQYLLDEEYQLKKEERKVLLDQNKNLKKYNR
jgi:hypothetical protein